jgi:hypothetical protein|tara:strand:+ start:314 stop:532 length:219 start_codon:yes stop_codon:yes gene_type:complete
MEEQQEVRRIRMGWSSDEMVADCDMGADSSTCFGVKCSFYHSCFEGLNPDENGYFNWDSEKMIEYSVSTNSA